MSNQTYKTAAGYHPRYSRHDLSHSHLLTCDMGKIIPFLCIEALPSDIFKIGIQAVMRFTPLVAPILHRVDASFYYFFVPNRLLWDDWEEFITGGEDGETLIVEPPYWTPTSTAKGTLWDYLGMPVGIDPGANCRPVDFPKRAYNLIYNEYFRDQNHITEVDITTNDTILLAAWEKDYFTSALAFQQRGVAPALPVSGTTSAVFTGDVDLIWPAVSAGSAVAMEHHSVNFQPDSAGTKSALELGKADKSGGTGNGLDDNVVDLSTATSVNISELRLAVQLQRFMEVNARTGVRYKEFLKGQFDTILPDSRLQRPEYITGYKQPIIVSEVLQTSRTDAGETPQGTMVGHGIMAAGEFLDSYRCPEFGWVIGVMVVRPKPAYQQGIHRSFLKESRYDYYFPAFANLSEQAIIREEIYANAVEADNKTIFGYQGRYDELRVIPNTVHGDMRDVFDYWHFGRQFAAAPALNQAFIECVPRLDPFADQTDDVLLCNIGNIIEGIRPIPILSIPGLVDH